MFFYDFILVDFLGHLKLIDFGFAKRLEKEEGWRTRTNCGTLQSAEGEDQEEARLGVPTEGAYERCRFLVENT